MVPTYVLVECNMIIKEFLGDLMLEKAPGPNPSFTVFDMIRVLEIIAEKGSKARGKLSEKLGLGEGVTRTLISRLKDADLLFVSKGGCVFTEKGKKVWKELRAVLPCKVKLKKNKLTFAEYNVAVLVKGRSKKVEKGLEQRDAAVRARAKGATTLIFKGGRLILPTISTDLAKDYPKAFRQITRLMNLEENDVVIIGCGDHLKEAEYGALAAAWTII